MLRLLTFIVVFLGSAHAMIDSDPTDNQATAADPASLAQPADYQRYGQPEELKQLCSLVRQKNKEMDARNQTLVHNETTTAIEFDRKGKESDRQKVVERVWTVNNQEHRLIIKKEANGEDITPPDVKEETRAKGDVIFPLATNEPEGAYRYAFAGAEMLAGRPTIKINFEPTLVSDKRLRGQIWVDPATMEPARFFGRWAKLPAFTTELNMLLDWGITETGAVQLRRSIINGAGGVAFIQKRYRIETDLTDYRPPSSQP